jgi:hypothetical protein
MRHAGEQTTMHPFLDRRRFLKVAAGALATSTLLARADEPAKANKGLVVGHP